MKKRKNFAERIETNRKVLLRIISAWLVAASMFCLCQQKPFPKRIGRWICQHLYSLEKATHFLIIATSYEFNKQTQSRLIDRHGTPLFIKPANPNTLEELIERLKALRSKLCDLRNHGRLVAARRAFSTNIHFENYRNIPPLAHAIANKDTLKAIICGCVRSQIQCPPAPP